jgi:hypothetical protein
MSIVERLAAIRERIDSIKSERVRLTEQKQIHERRRDEIAAKCKEKFGIDIEEASGMIEKLQQEAEALTKEAEQILDIGENQ